MKKDGEKINSIVTHTVVFNDDRNTVYIRDNDVDGYFYDETFYLASSLSNEKAQEIYNRVMAYVNPVRK